MASDERLGEVTVLLRRWESGDAAAVDELLPVVYNELRALARASMAGERTGHTLSGTALVHEAYLRLSKVADLSFNDRAHFFAVAARTMRRILVDHARSQFAEKRVGAHLRQPILEDVDFEAPQPETIVAIDELLDRLKEVNPRAGELVELRFFGGLTETETAEVLGVSRSTLTRDWRFARLWLYRQLTIN
ncbi:MAG: sigma-70 family RNA polymerase sigma factor [bacterium]|nr:sigma-70 family RNA polymerase sigma factor [bacterium]